MSWFGKKEWAVVMMTHGSSPFGVDGREHVAIAVRHWPQINAATILTGLSKSHADREVSRLNDLNHPNKRAMRIADLYSDLESPHNNCLARSPNVGEKPMTDPMELVGRLENFDGGHQKDAYSLIDEAAACIREMVEWRPIETAPVRACMGVVAFLDPSHDALSALGNGRDERCELAWFDGKGWRESGTAHLYDERDPEHRPTHWLPLPSAPGAEA